MHVSTDQETKMFNNLINKSYALMNSNEWCQVTQ